MANLITLTEYKELEGISNTQHDARTEVIISSVSQLIKTYCGNSIIDHYSGANKVETISINYGTNAIQLTESPIVTIVTVQERTDIGGAYTTLSNTDDVEVDAATDTLYRISGGHYQNWEQGINSVKITYAAGYSTTPADLLLAVADTVTYYLKGEHKERKTIKGATIQNARSDISFPDHIKRVLDLYRTY
tara:strand:- start:1000 stop:1572 length:573 start_codon:yes stop_codon:yes gene_type:complete